MRALALVLATAVTALNDLPNDAELILAVSEGHTARRGLAAVEHALGADAARAARVVPRMQVVEAVEAAAARGASVVVHDGARQRRIYGELGPAHARAVAAWPDALHAVAPGVDSSTGVARRSRRARSTRATQVAAAEHCAAALPDAHERFGAKPSLFQGGAAVSAKEALAAAAEARGPGAGAFLAALEARCRGRVRAPADVEERFPARYVPPAPRERRRRLGNGHPGEGPLQDAYYSLPLADVRDTPQTTIALEVGFAGGVNGSVHAFGGRDVGRLEAFCLLARTGGRIAFLGDSISRYHYFALNEWLTHDWLTTHSSGMWGQGENSFHYDTADVWNEEIKATHAQHLTHEIPVPDEIKGLCGDVEALRLEYWFVADWHTVGEEAEKLFEKTVAPWADVVLAGPSWREAASRTFLGEWWELKDCGCGDAYRRGDPAGCQQRYRDVLQVWAKKLLSRVPYGYLRAAPCCGESTTERCVNELDSDKDLFHMHDSDWDDPPDEVVDRMKHEAMLGVVSFNEILWKWRSEQGWTHVPVLDVHGLSNPRTVHGVTMDGKHPAEPLYHIWSQIWLSMLATDDRLFPLEGGARASDQCAALTVEDDDRFPKTMMPSPRPRPRPTAPPTAAGDRHCRDGKKNSGETEVDCGGTCAACDFEGARCKHPQDCTSDYFCDRPCKLQHTDCTSQPAGRCVPQTPAPTRRPAPRPTGAPVADADDMGDDGAFVPDFVDDDPGVGYGPGSDAVTDVVGPKTVREGGPGSCAAAKAVTPRLWRAALKASRRFLKKMVAGKGVCVLGPGPRLIALALFAALGALGRGLAVKRRPSETGGIEMVRRRGPATPTRASAAEAPAPSPTRAALELGFWLLAAAYCDRVAPSAQLPAGTRSLSENPDLWFALMALLALVCYAPPMLGREEADAFFGRAQCNEWKGWMQVAFVAYHYANAQDVYVPVRWFVSAYVWLTGFGNAIYFWRTEDTSPGRFLKMVWRINFFAAPLSLATGTAWIAYYVVALHTVHFAVCFLSFLLSKLVVRGLGVCGGGGEGLRTVCALAMYLAVCVVIWEAGLYEALVGPFLHKALGEGFERYFWYRTRMDYLSSFAGACAGALLPAYERAWRASAAKRGVILGLACVPAVAGFAAWFTSKDHAVYILRQPYVGTLWVPLYAVLRNATPWLRQQVSAPLAWVGARSLELYLLQFHLLMNRSADGVLWLLPDENWPLVNLGLTATLWLFGAGRVFSKTARLRDAAERAPGCTALALLAAAAAYALVKYADAPCAPAQAAGALSFAAALVSLFAGYVFADVARRASRPEQPYESLSKVDFSDEDEDAEEGTFGECPPPPFKEAETPERFVPHRAASSESLRSVSSGGGVV